MSKRVLALDVSTKTGYALIIMDSKGYKLETYGTLDQVHTPEGSYPQSFVVWAYEVYQNIEGLIEDLTPDCLVIEETSAGSKAIYTQKILEWIHFLLARFIKETSIEANYIMIEEWRRETGCKMNKAEKLRNKYVRDYKKKHKTKLARDKNGKIVGLITRKHVNVRRMNELFKDQLSEPLRQKDEDQADALGLAVSYYLRCKRVKSLE